MTGVQTCALPISAGVPEELIEIATRRLQKINEAYALILKERTT